jgi:hypothetical protein
MPRTLFASAVVAALVSWGGCGGSSPASPSGSAVLALSIAPNPVPEAVCPPSACGTVTNQLYAVGTLTLRETGGVGGRVDSVSMTQRTGAGATMGTGQFDATAVATLASTNRFVANGVLSIPGIGVHYDRSLGGSAATLTVTLQATDDGGHTISATIQAPVAP